MRLNRKRVVGAPHLAMGMFVAASMAGAYQLGKAMAEAYKRRCMLCAAPSEA